MCNRSLIILNHGINVFLANINSEYDKIRIQRTLCTTGGDELQVCQWKNQDFVLYKSLSSFPEIKLLLEANRAHQHAAGFQGAKQGTCSIKLQPGLYYV